MCAGIVPWGSRVSCGRVSCGRERRSAVVACERRREYPARMGETPPAGVPLSPQSRIVLAKDQVSCDLAGEAAIVNLNNGVYYGLDPVGARVWNLMREPVTFAAVVDAMLATYRVDRPTLESDLRAFVARLVEQGLVEISA
jgi:hypothetical protein